MSFSHVVIGNLIISAVMAVAIALLSRVRPLAHRPAFQCALWCGVLLKLMTPPLVSIPLLPALAVDSVESSASDTFSTIENPIDGNTARRHDKEATRQAPLGTQGVQAATITSVDEQPSRKKTSSRAAGLALTSLPLSSLCLITLGLVSAGGMCWILARGIRRWIRFAKIVNNGNTNCDRLRKIAKQCATEMQIRETPQVALVDGMLSPGLWTRGKVPMVVFPRQLPPQLDDEQLAWIIRHELAHFRRRDRWIDAFTFLVTAIWWWNPIAWWARREIVTAQELCCDALVVSSATARRARYAETLLQVIDFLSPPGESPMPVGSSFAGNRMRRRFAMIAETRVSPVWSTWMSVSVLMALMLLPCLPVRRSLAIANEGISARKTLATVATGGVDSLDDKDEDKKQNAPPAKPIECTMTFVTGDAERPLQNIEVQLAKEERDHAPKWRTLRTNEQGQISTTVPDGTRVQLRLKSKSLWCSQQIIGVTAKSHEHVIKTWEGSRLSGRLMHGNGKPVSKSTLSVAVRIQDNAWKKRLGLSTAFNTWDHGDWGNWLTRVETNDNGEFSATVPDASALHWIRVGSPSFRTGSWFGTPPFPHAPFEVERVHDVETNRNADIDLGQIVLPKTVRLHGRVLDTKGKAVTNARVSAHAGIRQQQIGKFYQFASTETDDRGRYEFKALLSGDATLGVYTPAHEDGHFPTLFIDQKIVVSNLTDDVELTIRAVEQIDLRIKWVDRRENQKKFKFRYAGQIKGKVVGHNGELQEYGRRLTFIEYDGKKTLVCTIPKDLLQAGLFLPAADGVRFSYEDEDRKSEPGRIVPLDNLDNLEMMRTVYTDDKSAGVR